MSQPPPRVLIIENSREQWGIHRRVMKKLGLPFDEVRYASEAFALLERETYALIIQDLALPQKPGETTGDPVNNLEWGVDVFRRIRKMSEAPVIVVSAFADTLNGRAALEVINPSSILAKPLVPARLEEAVRRHLPPDSDSPNSNSPPPS